MDPVPGIHTQLEGPEWPRLELRGNLEETSFNADPLPEAKTEVRRGQIEGLWFPRELVTEQDLELRSPEFWSSSTGS